MNKIIIKTCISLVIAIALLAPLKSDAATKTQTNNQQGTSSQAQEDQAMQALLEQVQKNQAARREQIAQNQQQQQNANQNQNNQASNQEQNKNLNEQISGWVSIILIVYGITILLSWIFLVMSIFSMAKWLRMVKR